MFFKVGKYLRLMLKLKSFKGGFDGNFSYVLYDGKSREAAVIDTSIEPAVLLEFIGKNNLNLKFVVVMHGHFDHLIGLDFYQKKGIPVYAHESFRKKVKADKRLKEGAKIKLGDSVLKVLHTPGHIYDAICLLTEGKLFTSDTLFVDGCGRCDLAGADREKMRESLEKIKQLPDETMIYPGHDYGFRPYDRLGSQKKRNKCLWADSGC